ncbi:MAG: hypothetical protein AAGD38_13305 [Acidobacteriota bacterium]
MRTPRPAPLGLSDLTRDECLIVSISRAWRLEPTHAEAEQNIARLLRNDPVYPALDTLFAVFPPLFANEPVEAEGSDLLSANEETLLDQLSSEALHCLDYAVHACRTALRQANIELRPLGIIERSGHDRLVDRIAESYRIVMHMSS